MACAADPTPPATRARRATYSASFGACPRATHSQLHRVAPLLVGSGVLTDGDECVDRPAPAAAAAHAPSAHPAHVERALLHHARPPSQGCHITPPCAQSVSRLAPPCRSICQPDAHTRLRPLSDDPLAAARSLDGARLFARRIGRPLAELLPPEAAPSLDSLSQQPLLRQLGGHPAAIVRSAAAVSERLSQLGAREAMERLVADQKT